MGDEVRDISGVMSEFSAWECICRGVQGAVDMGDGVRDVGGLDAGLTNVL
jgi:hypothetical protein